MLVLLPPSETKTPGGAGQPLDLDNLSHPDLNPTRRKLLSSLSTLAKDVPASLDVLGISERQVEEVRRNARLWDAPTEPTLRRYTGVLYDALDIDSLPKTARQRAYERIAVASALFGILEGGDAIPAYRLSGGNALPDLGSLRAVWRPVLEPVLQTREDLIVDLRSGTYAALAKVPDAVAVRVLSEDSAGHRKVVSHHNKFHKGKLARALATSSKEPSEVEGVLAIARKAGLRAERDDHAGLCVVVPA